MFLSVVISPATATTKTYPTYISVYGNDFHDGVFTVHTNDTQGKHNLKAEVRYKDSKGEDKILNPHCGDVVCFECWEKPDQDNNGNGITGERLYTEKDRALFDDESEVNPAKWHKHGVPTGEYNIKIIFRAFWSLRRGVYSASGHTILFRLLP